MSRPLPGLVDLAADRPSPLAAVPPEELVASAVEHRMDGLVHTEVREGRLALPEGLAARLAVEGLYRQRRAASLWAAHDALVAAAAAQGTEVATVKGPSAELRWYRRVGERPCVDLDAWLRPGSPQVAVAVVAALEPGHPLLRADLAGLIGSGRLQSLDVALPDATIDLHFDLLKLGVASHLEDELWARTVTMDVGDGRTARVLDPVAALLHLLVHLNKDRFCRLLGLADIARLLEREQPDLGDLEGLARRAGLEVPVLESLRATVDELGLPEVGAHGASGPRARVWRVVWRRGARLRGEAGRTGMRYRQALLPVLLRGPGRRREAARRYRQMLLPSPVLVAYRNPGVEGGYAKRLVIGRTRRWRERRAARAAARG
jgi:hypothetical protein